MSKDTVLKCDSCGKIISRESDRPSTIYELPSGDYSYPVGSQASMNYIPLPKAVYKFEDYDVCIKCAIKIQKEFFSG